jgi:hypothetical protein
MATESPPVPKAKPVAVTITLLAAIIGSVSGTVAVNSMMGRGGASIDATLVKTASEINKTMPMMVDQITRLENVMALPGKKLAYNYTLLNLDPMADATEFIQNIRPRLVNGYQTSSDMAGLRKAGVTLIYVYRDEQGREFAKLEVAAHAVE